MEDKLYFSSDYMEGAHPAILQRLLETNLEKTTGYGYDQYCDSAKEKIRAACKCPNAAVYFLVGGTQTNVTVIDSLLRSYMGVLSADSGHVSVHEAGAIEFGGHKVLTLPQKNGKITAEAVEQYIARYEADENWEHIVMPGMVYISHPTEYGTLYSLEELKALSSTCRRHHIPLYLDGARLAYALACPENELTMPILAEYCDAFYIGGTKCGALFGEALVLPDPNLIPHFFTIIKQHGALLAKGRIAGIQFDTLFTDDLYQKIGIPAQETSDRIRRVLTAHGYPLCFDSPTNQVFCIAETAKLPAIAEKVAYGYIEPYDDTHTIIRFCTSWASVPEDADRLSAVLDQLS